MNRAQLSAFSPFSYGASGILVAAPPSIGVIRSIGYCLADVSTVRGNVAEFEGATFQSNAAPSTIQLSNGTEIILESDSLMQMYRDKSVLQRGDQGIKNTYLREVTAEDRLACRVRRD
jgi:hypothetical protein